MDTDAKDLFEILVHENTAMLKVYVRSAVRDWAAGEDLFQDTILAAWQTLDRFDRTRPFGPWLRGIAAKKILAYYRQFSETTVLSNEMMLEVIDSRMAAIHCQSGDTFEEKLEYLRKCLAELPEMFRETIRQRYMLRLSRQEMAERLNITDEAVKKRLQRARTQLLDCILRGLSQGVGNS